MPTEKSKTTFRQKFRSFGRELHSNPKSYMLMMVGTFLLIFALFWFFHTPNRQFEELCDTLFIKELSEDGLSLHYTLSNPGLYGIDETTHTLPAYDKTKSLADYQSLLNTVVELESIDRESLNKTNQRTYDILLKYLLTEIEAYAYLYYDEPLSPASGMQSQLPILLAEYTLRSKNDIENYLCLLQSIPSYLGGLAQFEQEKSQAGLFMSTEACRDTILQCNEVITEEELLAGNHFLQISFQERLQTLVDSGEISQREMDAYIQANNEILAKTVLPAYKSLAHSLTSLQGSGTNENGLYYYPEGREYYEILVERQTGSSKDIDDIMASVKTSFMADYSTFVEVIYATQAKNNNSVFSISEPDKMLADLENCIWEDFPVYPSVREENMPFYEIKEVSETMEDYLSPAFYLTPPMDDISQNVIYINYGTSPENLELYTTLAHEGYPGHLYQSVYSTLALEDEGAHPIRNLLHFGGYVEGYATYAELLSYDYAKEFGDEDYCDLVRLNRKLHLALYSMLDISIHYYGATYEEAHETLSAFGIEDKKITREIYDYIVNSPGNYLQYYVGYLEIMECRELARVKWKDNYSDYNFHEFFLDFGPADFETIQNAIREYKAPEVPQEVTTTASISQSQVFPNQLLTMSCPSQFLQCGWFPVGQRREQEILLHRQWT